VSLLLTDAPADFVKAEVKIEQIYLQGSATDSSSRVVLYDGSETFDLLDLQNGVTAELAEVTVPAGTYSQLRIVVAEGELETEGGQVFSTSDGSLKCPSCAQSGLKIKLPDGGLTLEDGENKLVVDFDVSQSFGHEAGNSGKWVMHPVIHATHAEAAGAISGMVTLGQGAALPACGGGAVVLSSFIPTATLNDLVLTGTTDAQGNLLFAYAPSGLYTVGSQVIVYANGDQLTFSATPSVTTVHVEAGGVSTLDYTVTGASCTAST
jgi:hypothetical protein